MDHIIVCFEQQSVYRTDTQTLLIMLEAEADEKACVEERTQLLGLAPEAVKHPRLLWFQLFSQPKQPLEGFHAMDDERFPEFLAQPDLPNEDFLLHFHRRSSQAIKPAFANREFAREVRNDELFVRFPRVNAPSVATVNNGHNIPTDGSLMGVEIDIQHRVLKLGVPSWQTRRA